MKAKIYLGFAALLSGIAAGSTYDTIRSLIEWLG